MKKLLAVILAVTMALTYYPVSASAEGDNASEADTQTPPAAEPDNTHTAGVTEPEDGVSYGASIDYGDNTYYYRDLLSALSDIEDGDTIRLLSSFALSDYYYINPEGSVTIDLAGHSITSGRSRIYIGFDGNNGYYNSDVTITDSAGGGRITAGASQAVIYVSNGSFTLAGGTISNSYNPADEYAYGIYAKRSSKVNITGGSITAKVGVRGLPADITMSGGVIESSAVGVFLNGSDSGRASFTMTGGEINGNENDGIYAYSGAEVNISGGAVSGKYGIETREKSNVNIFGGEISGTTASLAVIGSCMGTLTDGILRNSVVVAGDGAGFVMNGGTVTGTGSDAAIITSDEENGGKSDVIINGGTISASDTAIYLAQDGSTVIKGGKITGSNGITQVAGSLEISPSGDEDVYIAAGGTPAPGSSADNNGASSDGAAVAVIGSDEFAGNIELKISGGTFRSDYGMGLWVYSEDKSSAVKKIGVTGGTFTGGMYSQSRYAACAAYGLSGFVKGGTFSTDVSALTAFGYDAAESSGIWKVDVSVTYGRETSDIEKDDAGNTVTKVVSEGSDKAGNKVTRTSKTTKDAEGKVTGIVATTVYEYSDHVISMEVTDQSRVSASIEIPSGFDDSTVISYIERIRGTAASEGIEDTFITLVIKSDQDSLAVSAKLLQKTDAVSAVMKDVTYRLTASDIEYILENMSGDSFMISKETLEEIKDVRISSAKAAKTSLSSVTKASNHVTASWNRVEGVDGYTVVLITGGKKYTEEIDSADRTSVTFAQNVTKSYRVRVSTFTYIDGEKIQSESTYRTYISKPVYSSASKNSAGKVTVKWKKMTSVDGFKVQMTVGSRTYTKYMSASSASCTFTPKVTKSYRIRLYSYSSIEGRRVYSAVTTKTYISKPTMTALSRNKSTQKVTAKWRKLSSVSGYRVRLNANGKTYTKIITSNSKTSYTFPVKVKGTYTVSISSYSVFGGVRSYTDYRTYKAG